MGNQTKSKVVWAVLVICFMGISHSILIAQEQDSVSMTLIEPTQDMPLFNLHSPKLGTNRDGEATLEFSYSQTRPGKNLLPDVIIRLGNSEQGQKMIFGAIANTLQPFRVRLPPERLKQVKSEGVEILFIGDLWSITGNLGSRQSHHHYFKLSNSILLGSAREQATTRPPNPQDQNAVANGLNARCSRSNSTLRCQKASQGSCPLWHRG